MDNLVFDESTYQNVVANLQNLRQDIDGVDEHHKAFLSSYNEYGVSAYLAEAYGAELDALDGLAGQIYEKLELLLGSGDLSLEAGRQAYLAKEQELVDQANGIGTDVGPTGGPNGGSGGGTNNGTNSGTNSGDLGDKNDGENDKKDDGNTENGTNSGVDLTPKDPNPKGYNNGGINSDYNSGYNSNYNSGYNSNYNSGINANYNSGYNSNYNSGFNSSYNSGYNSSYNSSGYNSSYNSSGYNSNYNSGYNSNYNSGTNTGYNSNYNSGYNSNYNSGYNSNYNSGTNTGYNSNYNSGYNSNYNSGTNSGSNSGYNSGFNSGYVSGSNSGTNSGRNSASTIGVGTSTGKKAGTGKSLTGSLKGATGKKASNIIDAIEKGAARLAKGISPRFSGEDGSGISAAAIAGAGLAGAGVALGTGILVGKRFQTYTFTPEDWENVDDPTKEAIIADMKKAEFSDSEIETFKNSTFKIRASELNEHTKKITKANEIDETLEEQFKSIYNYSLFDDENNIVRYYTFITMIIDGNKATDDFNMYNILNPILGEEDDADFIYTGITMEEYIFDEDDVEEVEVTEENENEMQEGQSVDAVDKEWLTGIGLDNN